MSEISHHELVDIFLDSLVQTAKSFGELFISSVNSSKQAIVEWADQGGITTLMVILTALFFVVWALL